MHAHWVGEREEIMGWNENRKAIVLFVCTVRKYSYVHLCAVVLVLLNSVCLRVSNAFVSHMHQI